MTGALVPRYHLALRHLHAGAGASFTDVEGWSIPAHYGHARAELESLRERAAIADRSHRSRIIVSGPDAADVLGGAFQGHAAEIEEGRVLRSVSLAGDGTIADVVLIARIGGIAYLVTGEAGRRHDTLRRLRQSLRPDFDARIDDRTESTCTVAIAGPQAADLVAAQVAESLPARLPSMHTVSFEFHGFRATATRTSDTGEDGFELMVAPAVAQHLIETLPAHAMLTGHEAWTTARVEACVPAFTPDLEPGLTPAEADLDALLGIDGGRAEVTLAAVVVDAAEAVAAGTPVVTADDGAVVGEVRSCVRSHPLDATIGLAVLDVQHAFPGTALRTTGGHRVMVVQKPFHRRRMTA